MLHDSFAPIAENLSFGPSYATLVKYGAKSTPMMLDQNQVWRFVSFFLFSFSSSFAFRFFSFLFFSFLLLCFFVALFVCGVSCPSLGSSVQRFYILDFFTLFAIWLFSSGKTHPPSTFDPLLPSLSLPLFSLLPHLHL